MCGICGKLNNNSLCFKCEQELKQEFKFSRKNYYQDKEKNFVEQYYLFKYQKTIRNLILSLKFGRKPYIYKTIAYFFEKNKKQLENLQKYDIIIAVPLSKRRMLERGYNQSQFIAQAISKITEVKLQRKILYKTKNVVPQSTLNKEQRESNIKNVYKAKNVEKIIDKKILLVDDICTTGSTLNECAKTLIQNGIRRENIGVFTIAKD